MERRILLTTVEEAKELILIASDCDFDVTLKRGSLMVDAKSIIGVLSLDLREPLDINTGGENAKLEAFIEEHLA
ncbi:MAG: HPr family phosphocarrier protein [Eubacteriales bacterium]|nr:HPr family phosphocarrier protein [Eubacteriales bacterium]